MSVNFLNDAVLQAKIIKESAIAQAKESLLESLDSRVKSMASKRLIEGDGGKDGEYANDKEVVDVEDETPKSDVEGDDSTPSDDEIEEIMKELRTEGSDLSEEYDEIEESEELEESEDELTEEEEQALEEISSMFENEDELTEEDEQALEEISSMFENEHELTEEDELSELELTEEDELELTEEDELEESDEVNETRLRKLYSVIKNPASSNRELREAAGKIVKLKSSLKKANKVIQIQNEAIKDASLLNKKVAMFNRLTEGLTLDKNQKLTMINVLDTATNMRELKLAYLGLLEGIKSAKTSSANNVSTPVKRNTAVANYKKTNTSSVSSKLRSAIRESLNKRLNRINVTNEDAPKRRVLSENNTRMTKPSLSNRLTERNNKSGVKNTNTNRLVNRLDSRNTRLNANTNSNGGKTLRERLAEKLGVTNTNNVNRPINGGSNRLSAPRNADRVITNRLNTVKDNNRIDTGRNRLTENRVSTPNATRPSNKRFNNDIITKRRLNESNENTYKAPILTDDYLELRDRLMKLGNVK